MNVEQHLIGGCLAAPDMVRFAARQLTKDDFHDHRLGGVFETITRMLSRRDPVDPMTVADQARKDGVLGVEFSDLLGFMSQVSSGVSVERYASQVKEQSMRRDLQAVAARLVAEANNPAVPVVQALSGATEELKRVMEANNTGHDDPKLLADILAVDDVFEWAIPGMLEKGDRMLVTGFEGGGKSTLLRQIVVLASAGIQPFTFDPIDPVRCMVVDVENSERQWRRAVRGMVNNATRFGSCDPSQTLHIRSGMGLNITNDADLGKLHGWIDQHEPQVLMIGPLYKLVPGGIRGDEEASPVIAAIDSIRERGVAIVMEGHAAKGTDTHGTRNLSPRGSAALMGWPEFGFGLYVDAEAPEKVDVIRWRGDREKRSWPSEFYRGGIFPWTADTASPQRRNEMLRAA